MRHNNTFWAFPLRFFREMEKTAADQAAVFEEKGFYLHVFDEFADKMKRGAERRNVVS